MTSSLALRVLAVALVPLACGRTDRQERPDSAAKLAPGSESPRVAVTAGDKLSPNDSIPRLWRIGNTEDAPVMYLVFESNGQFSFKGGFEEWSPGAWSYNVAAKELIIALPKLDSSGVADLETYGEQWQLRFDSKSKTLTYPFTQATTSLTFAGYNFFPVAK